MEDFQCSNGGGSECTAHLYVMKLIAQLKEDQNKMEADQKRLVENSIRLTENFGELQRLNEKSDIMLGELRKYNKVQDEITKGNSTFVTKAVTVIGSISFIAALTPLFIWLFSASK